jgi:CRP-like cAMP-binding protein
MLDLLLQNTTKHISFTNEEANLFLSFFKPKTLKKKEFLLKEGEICKFEGFITKGLFKVFHFDDKGFEQILNFPMEDWWITDIDSFTNQIPSQYFIQALEYSEILVIDKKDKERLYEELHKVEKLFRIMSQKRLISLQRRISENLKKNSEQRYLDFLEKYPQLSQRVTNLQIASYIGISHELVSKIRKKVFSKK